MEVEFVPVPDHRRGLGHSRAIAVRETNMSRLSVFSQGGIHIHPQSRNGSNVLEHAMVFMTWDVSATTAAAIKKHRLAGRSVALLIVQWDTSSGHHRQYNETRRLVNLNERRLSICFESPGTHRILALVVAGDSEGALHDKYLSSTSADYKTTVVTWDGFGVHDDVMEDTSATGCVDVEVPEGLFAKTPPDIWWLTRLIKTPPRDTCALPWRRIFAYFPLFQPLIIFIPSSPQFNRRARFRRFRRLCGG